MERLLISQLLKWKDSYKYSFRLDEQQNIRFCRMFAETGLPAANVLIYTLESGATVVVRPSGTEPKIKTYFTTKGKDLAEAEAQKEKLAEACKPLLA